MIENLEFSRTHLNPRLLNGDIGAAFADFAFEVLADAYPGLARFRTAGKDGGIDLSATAAGRTVVECKHVGDGGVAAASARWAEVARRLDRNLADPAGPPLGQRQYEPWYRTDPAIDTYVYCVSRRLPNQQGMDALKREIRSHFAGLAADRPHLAHLRGITVRVVDLGALIDMTGRRAHLLYRWFPATRPIGLLPLEEPLPAGGFRAYLTSARLPHYSLRRHRERAAVPDDLTIHDEQDLLAALDGGDATGLIITGAGGFGKTRLTAEIGELAHRQEWTVLRALASVDRAAIEQLGELMEPGERVLLLFDYVEVQQGFQDLVGLVNDLNDQYGFELRYVANCRRSYYNHLAALPRHVRFNLSPLDVESHASWYRDYQRAVVDHILEHSGLEATEAHIAVCHQTPVLAVFLSYLHDGGRNVELRELLNEQNFASWVLRRVQLSTGGPVEGELATLMTILPFAVDAPLDDELRKLLEPLAADGWIEPTPADSGGGMLWATAHDVLADQIVITHLDRVALTAAQFVDATLACGEQLSHLPSALASLQRVADVPALAALDWGAVLDARIDVAPDAWRAVRSWLLETTLLTPVQQVAMLERHAALWDGDERSLPFQRQLGRLARWALEHEARTGAPIAGRATLERWIALAAQAATEANDIVTTGLRFAPEQGRDTALRWLRERAAEFHTHYLLLAWLRVGLPPEDVAPQVLAWTEHQGLTVRCALVLRAWLDAGGDREVVRGQLDAWLAVHGERADASFAYAAWLLSGGERELIGTRMSRWLERHALADQFPWLCAALLRTTDDPAALAPRVREWLARRGDEANARILYDMWLERGADVEVVREPLRRWLAIYGSEAEAGATYGAWLRASGERTLVEQPLAAWLELHALSEQFTFVCKGLLGVGADVDELRPSMAAWLAAHSRLAIARHVIEAWLDSGCDPHAIRDDLGRWLERYGVDLDANYVYRAWLDAGGGCEAVADAIGRWLAEHAEDPEAEFVYHGWLTARGDPSAVRASFMRWLRLHGAKPDANYVYRAWLDAGGGCEAVADAIGRWLAEHAEEPEADFVYRGWLSAGGDASAVREPLARWLARHGQGHGASFVYRAWLQSEGDDELVREPLLSWLAEHGRTIDASFVYSAWLRAGQSRESVETPLVEWCAEHGDTPNASFVYRAWLGAGGDPERVRRDLLRWLERLRHDSNASTVCCAWLDAGGDRECVRAHVKLLLAERGELPEARFLLCACLRADADLALEPAFAWIRRHKESADAGVLVGALVARHEPLPPDVVEAILMWCSLNPSHRGAIWGLSQLGRVLQEPRLAEQMLSAAEAVMGELASQPDIAPGAASLVTQLLCRMIGHASLREGAGRERVDALVLMWLRHSAGYPPGGRAARFVQHPVYFQRFIDLLGAGLIDYAGVDRGAVVRFLVWVDGWMPERKRSLAAAVRFLGHAYPAPDLWSLVTQSQG